VTADAPGGVVTWAIDRLTFKRVIVAATQKKREAHAAFLRRVPILATLTADEVATLADALQVLEVGAGTEVVREGEDGDQADRFYIVAEGELMATKEGAAERRRGGEGDGWVGGWVVGLGGSKRRRARGRAIARGATDALGEID
jgi:hypothetical protein